MTIENEQAILSGTLTSRRERAIRRIIATVGGVLISLGAISIPAKEKPDKGDVLASSGIMAVGLEATLVALYGGRKKQDSVNPSTSTTSGPQDQVL